MILRVLPFFLIAQLAAGPAAAALARPAGARAARNPSSTSAARPRAAASLPAAARLGASMRAAGAPVLSAIAAIEAADAPALRAWRSASPAAAFVAAVAARPALLEDEGVRERALATLGAPVVARLQSAAAGLAARARSDEELGEALLQLRRETPVVTPENAQAALARLALQFAAAPAAAEPEAVTAARLERPARRNGVLRRMAAAALAAATLSQAAPMEAAAQLAAPRAAATQPAAAAAAVAAPARQSSYARFDSPDELIARWTPGRHVYVSGDVGLDDAALRRLDAALAGTHWTAVLVEDSAGFYYRDSQGVSHRGSEAVDFAASQGLFAQGGFAAQVHPQTGERDGGVIVIVMNQRDLYVKPGDARRARGIDGDMMLQWATPRLQEGDIHGAVSETVAQLDARLAEAIARERQGAETSIASARTLLGRYDAARAQFTARHPAAASVGRVDAGELRRQVAQAESLFEQRQAERARQAAQTAASALSGAIRDMQAFSAAAASAAGRLEAAGAELAAVERGAARFRDAHRRAAGDLARPPLAEWRERLAEARRAAATDPRGAQAAADSLIAEARAHASALAEYPGGRARIDAATRLLDAQAGRERAGAAQQALTDARQELRRARASYEAGSSAWAGQLQAASGRLDAAEALVDEADASARAAARAFWGTLLALGLLTLGMGFFLNLRARRARRKAAATLGQWRAALDAKFDAIYGSDENAVNLDALVKSYAAVSRNWTGETKIVAEQVRRDSGTAKLLLGKARRVHEQAAEQVDPERFSPRWWRNLLWPSGYQLAERMLSNEPIEFKPEDGLERAFGRRSSWDQDLYGELGDYQPFSLSFEQLMERFNATSQAAVAALKRLSEAATSWGARFDAVVAEADKVAAARASLGAADGLFSVPAVFDSALPAARERIAASREIAKTDPVKSVEGAGAEAGRIVGDAAALVAAIRAARQGALASADASAKLIAQHQVENGWIAATKTKLSRKADKLAADAAAGPVADRIAALSGELAALAAKAGDVADGAAALSALRRAMDKNELDVAEARERIGAALGLPAASMMTEKGSNPAEFLANGRGLAERVDALLGAGKLEEALAVFAEAKSAAAGAAEIVAASLKSLETHEQVADARRAETERLQALVPERKAVLASIERDFAESVLPLSAGDATHPNANGTIKDNVEEAEASLGAALAKREKALRVFRTGELLLAAGLLEQVAGHQAIAQHRLDEISEKRSRLDAAVAANRAERAALEARELEYRGSVAGERRSMRPTLRAFQGAQARLAEAAAQVDAAKGDPFRAAAALASVRAALDEVMIAARNDAAAHAELLRSLKAAYAQLVDAQKLAQKARADGTADSPTIEQAYRDYSRLERDYGAAVAAEKVAHSDWNALDREADRLTNEAAHVSAALRGELAAAAKATAAISQAAHDVSRATNWTGSYGVHIPGSPGGDDLDRARYALRSGDYPGAIRHAQQASREAEYAIAQAVAEVNRRHQAELDRQAEERRREQARRDAEEERRRSSSGSSGGSWGGSRSGSTHGKW